MALRKDNCKSFPKCEYVGRSKRSFQERFSEHRDYVKGKKTAESAGAHSNLKGHSITHLRGLAIEKVRSSNPAILRAREHLYINKFDTYYNGLNKEP